MCKEGICATIALLCSEVTSTPLPLLLMRLAGPWFSSSSMCVETHSCLWRLNFSSSSPVVMSFSSDGKLKPL